MLIHTQYWSFSTLVQITRQHLNNCVGRKESDGVPLCPSYEMDTVISLRLTGISESQDARMVRTTESLKLKQETVIEVKNSSWDTAGLPACVFKTARGA